LSGCEWTRKDGGAEAGRGRQFWCTSAWERTRDGKKGIGALPASAGLGDDEEKQKPQSELQKDARAGLGDDNE